jgi:uncharacterized radical SAM protein YgiQ
LNCQVTDWLPTSRKEAELRGWDGLDVILFSGDAYVDHPSFGTAVIGRVLESIGLRVAVVPQPNWRDDLRDFKKLGIPRLFFGVSAGCMDSMVNHYTANKRLRSNDAYTAGNQAGFRPDYAVEVYSKILKNLYPGIPVIIGGIEASLRRLTHYDYWQDTLKPSILSNSHADMLVYGMGEHAIRTIAAQLLAGKKIHELAGLPQTGYLSSSLPALQGSGQNDHILLHSYEDCIKDKRKFAENFRQIETQSNRKYACRLIEPAGDKYVVINPPEYILEETKVDMAFDLPYTRLPHPRYKGKPIPAFEMIRFSVNIHRGCFGGCSFCTISAHQGKFIASRSEHSILNEVEKITRMPDFKGYLSDLGGPSANMFRMKGKDANLCATCSRNSCIYPKICRNLDNNHTPLLSLYRKVREMNHIKKVCIGSGIRYDLFLNQQGFLSREHAEYFDELLQHHVSGRLKVAPEHTVSKVLQLMRKPEFGLFIKMKEAFVRINKNKDLRQQLVPYFISSHPGCNEEDMNHLSRLMHKIHFNRLEQVHDFTPTPMTLSSVMFYCGFDPYSRKQIYVARKKDKKLKQKQYFFK